MNFKVYPKKQVRAIHHISFIWHREAQSPVDLPLAGLAPFTIIEFDSQWWFDPNSISVLMKTLHKTHCPTLRPPKPFRFRDTAGPAHANSLETRFWLEWWTRLRTTSNNAQKFSVLLIFLWNQVANMYHSIQLWSSIRPIGVTEEQVHHDRPW